MTASDDLTGMDESVINGSSITISMDVTNQHIAFTLQLKLVEAFEGFMKQLVDCCEFPEAMASVPLVFDKPIYGTNELTFTDFMAPGIILTIVHSMALGYSAMIIIIERATRPSRHLSDSLRRLQCTSHPPPPLQPPSHHQTWRSCPLQG